MIRFAKAQIASSVASLADYLITIFCVEILGFWYLAGTTTGTIIGGITNFSMGRRWVFNGGLKEKNKQLFRYGVVWMGYLLLTTSGVYLLTHIGNLNYLFSKVFVSLFLAIAYNFPLQKRFVFR